MVQWQAYHQVRAQLFNRQANYFEAARELVASAKYASSAEQKGISQSIWMNLPAIQKVN